MNWSIIALYLRWFEKLMVRCLSSGRHWKQLSCLTRFGAYTEHIIFGAGSSFLWLGCAVEEKTALYYRSLLIPILRSIATDPANGTLYSACTNVSPFPINCRCRLSRLSSVQTPATLGTARSCVMNGNARWMDRFTIIHSVMIAHVCNDGQKGDNIEVTTQD
jgi:hypothetical protein